MDSDWLARWHCMLVGKEFLFTHGIRKLLIVYESRV
jgi:hypothetical protein